MSSPPRKIQVKEFKNEFMKQSSTIIAPFLIECD